MTVLTLAVLSLLATRAHSEPAAAEQSGEFRLSSGGRGLAPIIVSNHASDETRAMAAELAHYLRKITGASFPIETGDGSTGIVLGTLSEFPDPALEKPLEIRAGSDGREAFSIRTEPARLRLIGATDLGASHAAFAFLEQLGCRWFFQAPEWEVIPLVKDLTANISLDDRPAILSRRIWYGGGLFEHDPKGRPFLDYHAWMRHNRMAQSFTTACGHAWQAIVGDNEATFDAHPEYLALVDGKRQGEQLCVSNPDLRKLATEWALRSLEKQPRADMVSMETSDGGGHCECSDCAKLGSVSDRAFLLANEVARAVAKEKPGKMVGMLAYNDHSEPPSFALEPNVYVQLTAGFTRGKHTFEELARLWPEKCANMGFYEYLSVWPWDWDKLPGGRANDMAYLRKQIPLYARLGATSIDCESSANFGIHGRGYYLANKLMWNPTADGDAILADFYQKAFGPAAPAMRRYYERFDKGGHPLVSVHLMALGFRDVREAAKLAADSPEIQARLDHIKIYLRSMHLRWKMERAVEKEEKKALTLACLSHGFRTRYTYVNHWVGMRDDWSVRAAKEFDEPSWAAAGDAMPMAPWAVDRPYTPEEVEAEFQEGLAFFQPDPVEELQFTNDLVAVEFPTPAEAAPVASVQRYQGAMPYSLYSLKGEPLELTVVAGTIAHYRDFAPAKWTITDGTGMDIAHGVLPLDGQPHLLKVPVPAAGAFLLTFDDSNAGWEISAAPGRKVTVSLVRKRRVESMGEMQPMHFYVPKGTKELHYYWHGGPHQVHGPDGTVLKEVATQGEFVKIPVPDGADGRTWHLSKLALGHLWLFNAPNLLAASPDALLVPRELADRDGLLLPDTR